MDIVFLQPYSTDRNHASFSMPKPCSALQTFQSGAGRPAAIGLARADELVIW